MPGPVEPVGFRDESHGLCPVAVCLRTFLVGGGAEIHPEPVLYLMADNLSCGRARGSKSFQLVASEPTNPLPGNRAKTYSNAPLVLASIVRRDNFVEGQSTVRADMSQVKSTKCYIEEYENERGQLSVRLREKATGRKVDLGLTAAADKQDFLQFLTLQMQIRP